MNTNKKIEARLIKDTVKNLKAILKTVKTIANAWDKNTIPLTVFLEIVKKGKLNEKTELKEFNIFAEKYNITLMTMYRACVDKAEKMNSKDITVDYVQQCISVIVTTFKST